MIIIIIVVIAIVIDIVDNKFYKHFFVSFCEMLRGVI